MHEKELKGLETISQAVGSRPDMVQGGGGNTSVKLDDKFMAIKASGFELKYVTHKTGFVTVNYNNIKNHLEGLYSDREAGLGRDGADILKNNTVTTSDTAGLRPSVEAGFHSVMGKYVIHTHSVYANIVCCSKECDRLIGTIFPGKDSDCDCGCDSGRDSDCDCGCDSDRDSGKGSDRDEGCDMCVVRVPYASPGFGVTLKIMEAQRNCLNDCGRLPNVFLMENHGLIVTADSADECVSLNDGANTRIKRYFGIAGDYPEIKLEDAGEGMFRSGTKFLAEYLKKNKPDSGYFENTIIYPDIVVYLAGNISFDDTPAKVNINLAKAEVLYRVGYREALAMEETLVALFYVTEHNEKARIIHEYTYSRRRGIHNRLGECEVQEGDYRRPGAVMVIIRRNCCCIFNG